MKKTPQKQEHYKEMPKQHYAKNKDFRLETKQEIVFRL